ncbi:unnamed protein product [Ilex paraguariensis]|uniref:Sodium channel modifier 1 acidic C-terminal domain-containing protein n=1 Tax=Ilex paraguariensis TaxID=185542 RepID=A0ABC8S0N3_9AQUA
MHVKGSRHRVAESKLKERELSRQDEINKRIALSDGSISIACNGTLAQAGNGTSAQQHSWASKPLIEWTRKAALEVICNKTPQQSTSFEYCDAKTRSHFTNGESTSDSKHCSVEIEAASKKVVSRQSDFREHRERELKFIAAGWKRDCHGGWFRDENVEFDSDEEDPNICLA